MIQVRNVESKTINMDSKKLKSISTQLKKASKMHRAQALKIDGILKSLKTKK